MKNILPRLSLPAMLLASSCAGVAPSAPPPGLPPSGEAEYLPPFEKAVQEAGQDSPALLKYYLLDGNGDPAVQAEIGGAQSFQVRYDLKRLEAGSPGAYIIPFAVTSLETGEAREGALAWRPRRGDCGILLSFDDDYYEAWQRYFDLLERYNAKATFFVRGEYHAFCAAALERGHDVGYHGLSHLNLPKVSRQVFAGETAAPAGRFRGNGVPLDSFAYPYGFHEPWMKGELLKTYRMLRGFNASFQAYDRAALRGGFIISRSVDNQTFKNDDDFKAAIDIMFRAVKFIGRGLVLPITSHTISDDAEWGIKPQRLEYILQAAAALQLEFYRYSDVLDSL